MTTLIQPLGAAPEDKPTAAPANPRPCSSCPWRTENHGQPHPDGWFTKRNRDRLWAKLRRGDSMSCHKTDPNNPVPAGTQPVPEGTTTHECTGALILQQREFTKFQAMCKGGKSLASYKRENPKGMTRIGLISLAERAVFGGSSLGGLRMANPDMNEAVSHDALSWNPEAVKAMESGR